MLKLFNREHFVSALICIILGTIFLVIAIMPSVLATDWIPIPEINETNITNTTVPDETSQGLNNTLGVIRDVDWNSYIVGTLGFAYTLSILSYSAFYSVSTMLGAAETAAHIAGTVGAILLFAVIIIALSRGALKVAKVGSRYFILILVVIIAISLLFGFLVGV